MQLSAAILVVLFQISAAAPLGSFTSNVDTWQLLHGATALPTGTLRQPAIRYSHAAAIYQDEMIITHGYFYDADNHKPRWLSDTWAMSLRAPHKWREITPHLDKLSALQAYTRKHNPPAPCGRYGLSGAVSGDKLYIFGGTDGGFHKHGRDGFEQEYDYDELWVLDLKTEQWQILGSAASSKGPWPSSRHLHGAVMVQDKMLIHGGVGPDFGDIWAWDLVKKTWKQLFRSSGMPPLDNPGSLYAAAYIPIDCPRKHGFLVYGGRPYHAAQEELSADVWFFDLMRHKWTKLDALSKTAPQPSGRFYVGFAQVSIDASTAQLCSVDLASNSFEESHPMAFTAGASVHTPTMECTDETWGLWWDLDNMLVKWQRQTPLPFGYYHNTLVAKNDTVFSYGGHLCPETQGHLPYRYLNTVQAIKLGPTSAQQSFAGSGANSKAARRRSDRELKSFS